MIVFAGVLSLLIVFFIIGFVRAGTHLVKHDKLSHADAIVVLMGSVSDRMLQAIDLYQAGYANKIIMVMENMGNYLALEQRGIHITGGTEQCVIVAESLGVPPENIIILPGNALSTQQEATAVKSYLKINKAIDTLIIVSSSAHMRRASMIFTEALKGLDRKITILASPNKYTGFTGTGWWKNKEGIQIVGTEYLKILNFLLFDQFKL